MSPVAWFDAYDDVRTEDNGKSIFIGQYRGNIIVPKLPTEIPSLIFVATIRYPIAEQPNEIIIRIVRPGMELIEHPVPSPIIPPDLPEGEDVQFGLVRAIVPIKPCRLEKAGRLKVVAIVDGAEVYAGSLKIMTFSDLHETALPEPFAATMINIIRSGNSDTLEALQRLAADYVKAFELIGAKFANTPRTVFNMETARGVIRAVITKPLNTPPQSVEILGLPTGVAAEIESVDKYGATIHLKPPADASGLQVVFHTSEGPLV